MELGKIDYLLFLFIFKLWICECTFWMREWPSLLLSFFIFLVFMKIFSGSKEWCFVYSLHLILPTSHLCVPSISLPPIFPLPVFPFLYFLFFLIHTLAPWPSHAPPHRQYTLYLGSVTLRVLRDIIWVDCSVQGENGSLEDWEKVKGLSQGPPSLPLHHWQEHLSSLRPDEYWQPMGSQSEYKPRTGTRSHQSRCDNIWPPENSKKRHNN